MINHKANNFPIEDNLLASHEQHTKRHDRPNDKTLQDRTMIDQSLRINNNKVNFFVKQYRKVIFPQPFFVNVHVINNLVSVITL